MKIKVVVHEAQEGGYWAEVSAMRHARRHNGGSSAQRA
jgi:hypothetical protein